MTRFRAKALRFNMTNIANIIKEILIDSGKSKTELLPHFHNCLTAA